MARVDHVGICPADMETALRFYRDGLGLDVLFDVTLEADFEPLLGVRTSAARTVFLGDRDQPEVGRVELLQLDPDGVPDGAAAAGLPHRGACLLSFEMPVADTLRRLADLGLGGQPRTTRTPAGGTAAMVVDPDGVMVELLDQSVSFDSRPSRSESP